MPKTELLTDEQFEEACKVVHETFRAYIAKLPDLVNKMLDKAVLAILGFEQDSWNGKIKIDHCNGRKSVITDYLESQLLKYRDEQITPALQKITMPEVTDLIETIKEEVRDRYAYSFEQAVRGEVERRAAADAKIFVDEIANRMKELELAKRIQNMNTDLEDPNSFQGPLGTTLLEIEFNRRKRDLV